MNIKEAQDAIVAILEALPDSELPEFDRVEQNPDYGPVVYWGSHGYYIASTRTSSLKDGDKPNPLGYRTSGAWHAIEMEMVARASKRYFDDGGELRIYKRKAS